MRNYSVLLRAHGIISKQSLDCRSLPARGCRLPARRRRRADRELRVSAARASTSWARNRRPAGTQICWPLARPATDTRRPWASYRAYAYNLHVSSGAYRLTRAGSGHLAQLEMASADLMTGYALATIVAAWAWEPAAALAPGPMWRWRNCWRRRLSEFVAAAALGIGTGPEPRGTRQALLRPPTVSIRLPTAG